MTETVIVGDDLEWSAEDEEERPCDYGFDTPCVEPFLRDMGNCFECWLMLEEDKNCEEAAEP